MKKRILSVMLVMAMTAGMAAGCGNSDKNSINPRISMR